MEGGLGKPRWCNDDAAWRVFLKHVLLTSTAQPTPLHTCHPMYGKCPVYTCSRQRTDVTRGSKPQSKEWKPPLQSFTTRINPQYPFQTNDNSQFSNSFVEARQSPVGIFANDTPVLEAGYSDLQLPSNSIRIQRSIFPANVASQPAIVDRATCSSMRTVGHFLNLSRQPQIQWASNGPGSFKQSLPRPRESCDLDTGKTSPKLSGGDVSHVYLCMHIYNQLLHIYI